jgi:2-oxoglutarate ferredoxin oxidoreductase subunit delta
MAKIKGDIEINIERCKGCEVCVAACPFTVIGMAKEVNGKGYHYAMKINDDCTGCMNCAIVCPDGVITVYRAKVEAE